MQLIREHSATISLLVCLATVGWSWLKKWNWCAWADFHFKKKETKKTQAGREYCQTFPQNVCTEVRKSHHHECYAVYECETSVFVFQVRVIVAQTVPAAVLQEPTMSLQHVRPVHRVLSKWMFCILSCTGLNWTIRISKGEAVMHIFCCLWTIVVLLWSQTVIVIQWMNDIE